VRMQSLRSTPSNGRQTMLLYQEFRGTRYLDTGCFVQQTTSATAATCR